jgi:hypothetical protein
MHRADTEQQIKSIPDAALATCDIASTGRSTFQPVSRAGRVLKAAEFNRPPAT